MSKLGIKAAALFSAVCLTSLVALPSAKADQPTIRIGYLNSLSGVNAAQTTDMLDGFKLFLKENGGKLGGSPVKLFVADDQANPNLGRQQAQRLIQLDHVQVITGLLMTPVVLAIARDAFSHKVFLISENAAPSRIAGKDCSPYFFDTATQNDTVSEPLGEWANMQHYKRVFILAPNFDAGHDVLSGFKRFFKGKIVKELYTPMGQLDYASALTEIRQAKPDAVFAFYFGAMGISFVKQYAEAGMKNIPLMGPYTEYDDAALKGMGAAAIGAHTAEMWGLSLKNAANEKFIHEYREVYHTNPSAYSANAYDSAQLLNAGIRAVHGNINNKIAFSKALEDAKFQSVRGSGFELNHNHIPKITWYAAKVVKGAQGTPTVRLGKKIFSLLPDPFAGACKMGS